MQAACHFLNAVEKHILLLFCRPTMSVMSMLPPTEEIIKGAHLGLRRFLTTESFLKMMKNVFCFTVKSLFVLKIFQVMSSFFGHVKKRLD